MSKDSRVVELPAADEFFRQVDRLVKIQALAGSDVQSLYSQGIDAGIFRGEFTIPGFGQFFITRSVYESGYSIIECIVFDEFTSAERASAGARYLTLSRLSEDGPWILYGEDSGIESKDIERLTAFAQESPKEVFERLFDQWFYDYSEIVPDNFTLANIESIYDSSAQQS
jgi:hypothetical protein